MELSLVLIILVLSLISGLTAFIGVILAKIIRNNSTAITIGIGFSAGIMVFVSFLELLPASFSQIGSVYSVIAFIAGIILIALLNYLIPHIHLSNEINREIKNPALKTAYLCAIGLIMHDFPEGFAMANSYLVSPGLGLLISVSIALHNIPEEFAMAIPFVSSNKDKSLYKTAFISALAEPAGAVIGLIAVGIVPSLTSYFLSFAAGAMVYISFHELLPFAKKYGKISLFVVGAIISLIVYLALSAVIST